MNVLANIKNMGITNANMKHMNKLTSAIRHTDNKYWVPSEGLNDASSGNCRIVMQVPNECLKDSSSGKCGIIIQVPNECLKDSSR